MFVAIWQSWVVFMEWNQWESIEAQTNITLIWRIFGLLMIFKVHGKRDAVMALWTDGPCFARGLGVLLCSFLYSTWLPLPLSLPWSTEDNAHSHISCLVIRPACQLGSPHAWPSHEQHICLCGQEQKSLGRGADRKGSLLINVSKYYPIMHVICPCLPSNSSLGTSLVAQWLGLCTPNAESPGSVSGQRTRFHMPQLSLGTAK